MKTYKMLAVTIFVAFVQTLFLFGSIARADLVAGDDIESIPSATSPVTSLRSGIYRLNKAADVLPDAAVFDGEEESNDDDVTMAVEQGEAIQLTEMPDGRVLMKLQLPEEEQGQIANQLILSREEVAALDLQFVADGNKINLAQFESGYTDNQEASRGRHHHVRARHHRTRYGHRRGFAYDQNGRIKGGNHNCVDVVKSLIGFNGSLGNGCHVVSTLVNHLHWKAVSTAARITGMVCSWTGGWHGLGHTARFDGQCFVPTYHGNCGNPGHHYHLHSCAIRI